MPELQSQPAEVAGAGEIIRKPKMQAQPGQVYAEVEITRKTGEVERGWIIADVVGVEADQGKGEN